MIDPASFSGVSRHIRKYYVFGLLYFVQGSALAYFQNFQKPYLNSFDIDADTIGLLTSILLLPFILKIFIGLLSDRFNLLGYGHRRPYMIAGLVLALIAFGAASFVSPGETFYLYAAVIICASFAITLFDSTADGLACDATPEKDHGVVQAAMVGGKALGFILLSLLFGYLAQAYSYRVVFWIIALAMLVPIFPVLALREPDRETVGHFDWGAFRESGRPRFLVFLVYTVLYSFFSFGIDGQVTYFMSKEFGAPESYIGFYGSARGIGIALGAVLAGVALKRFGRPVVAILAAGLISAGALGLSFAYDASSLLVIGTVWGLMWAFQETVFLSLAMDIADARIAASMFALIMAVSNLGTAIGEGVVTGLTDDIGFYSVFRLLGLANLVMIPLFLGLLRVAPELRASLKTSEN